MMGGGGIGLPLGLGFVGFGNGLGWLLGMAIGLRLDDGGFLVKDRARNEAGASCLLATVIYSNTQLCEPLV